MSARGRKGGAVVRTDRGLEEQGEITALDLPADLSDDIRGRAIFSEALIGINQYPEMVNPWPSTLMGRELRQADRLG
ncbi:hypothetical protein [Shinella zoogloeoides]|uniref:hypothetical protein n=1 Tax=Shinella zoogloeoides TaxID=352475 RepID=UPI00299E97EC|nr:hypothetical protein [Shinella zoogloeoides]WPE24142.1 hypothetical protein ShzoTeo12_53620 [Shinella zoogloeoides]